MSEALKSAKKPAVKKVAKQTRRVLKGSETVFHDLYKLESSVMRKNVSYTKIPVLEPIEHCHWFHSVDSNGKKLDRTHAVGGHYHKIELKEIDGELTATCGPAIYSIVSPNSPNGKRELSPDYDQHTHRVSYIRSEQVTIRKYNDAAAMYVNQSLAEERAADSLVVN